MDVQPDKQNVDKLFSNTTYHIDFYQRQYKWNSDPVNRLLDDVFYKFNQEFEIYKDSNLEIDEIIPSYGWYYLNTYVTNKVDNKLYVVDGQQRLTTLTLILINLVHLSNQFDSELTSWIEGKVIGRSGYKTDFWMNHEGHKSAMMDLLKGKEDLDDINVDSGITAKNMVINYRVISERLNKELKSIHRFESFVFYFLHRLVLINLNVEQTDVPMVFEVINDRGVKLKSYEILKGKLLGQIDKVELEQLNLNNLWEEQINLVNSFKEDEIDQFFNYYLRAKFANTPGEGAKYRKDYHRQMFSDDNLLINHNPPGVISFLRNEFKYYTELYARVYKYQNEEYADSDYKYVYYNSLNDMDMQFMLILSACEVNDVQETAKIKSVSYNLDRLFCLLQLQRSYDSNRFGRSVFSISEKIRNGNLNEIENAFNQILKELISNVKGTNDVKYFSYGYFKETGIELEKRFKRYFFARVEKFIADNTNMNMKQTMYNLVRNTGSKNGFHIEHILAFNPENLSLFNNDDERFQSERNRLGGLLLLKGRDNISSNNETYDMKLKSYANTLYWNETLREDSYKSKLDFENLRISFDLNFEPVDQFGPNELENRHKLLYKISKIIWE